MRKELIRDTIISVLKKTLPIEYIRYFLSNDETAVVEQALRKAKASLNKASKPWPGEAIKPEPVEPVAAPAPAAPTPPPAAPAPAPESSTATPKMKPVSRKAYTPPEGHEFHYSDDKAMRAYKTILREFKRSGEMPHGHINFDPNTREVRLHTDLAHKMLDQASTAPLPPTPKAPEVIVRPDHTMTPEDEALLDEAKNQ